MTRLNLSTKPLGKIIQVTGAARSGKSEWAEYLASQSGKLDIVYVATAMMNPEDSEWQERIRNHQQRRPANWQTIAEPKNLVDVIASRERELCYLVDSLGSWVANLLELDNNCWQAEQTKLINEIEATKAQVIFVGEETGWGVIPAYASGRLFRDRLGELLRSVGEIADNNYLVTGGYAIDLCLLGTSLKIVKQ